MLREWALLVAWLMFLPGSLHVQCQCEAQNTIGWMLETWPCIRKDALPLLVSQLQHPGWMCLMCSFAVAQIGIWREYVAVFRLTCTDLICLVFLKESFKMLHDLWSREVTLMVLRFVSWTQWGAFCMLFRCVCMWEGSFIVSGYYGSKFTCIDWVGCGMRWRFFFLYS